jgi:tetratricopeptide (TPR) repeat protein
MLFGAQTAWAHGDTHDRIHTLTQEIELNKKNAELYLKRGRLHTEHSEKLLAEQDFQMALKLDPNLTATELARAENFYNSAQFLNAKKSLDKFLLKNPKNVDGLITRARTLMKLNQMLTAIADFSSAIENATPPHPEYFLERAEAQLKVATIGREIVVSGIDEGIKRLGYSVNLELKAIQLEIEVSLFDRALKRIDKLTSFADRKETWFAKKGDILRQANRFTEAKVAYNAALKEIESLTPYQAKTKEILELKAHIKKQL